MTFTSNSRGVGEVARSREVKAALKLVAEKIAEEARRIAPVASGAYQDSIHVEEDESPDGRGRARVVADDEKALVLEYGTSDTPKFRTLGRAADIKE